MVEGLNAIEGVRCSMPQGAFYVFPNIQGTGMKSREIADLLLYEAGVAGLSGTAFSPYELVHEAYDNTNFGDERGTLVGFVSDEAADGVFALSAEERRQRILTSLSHYYGEQALSPAVYYESDWGTEEWTRGAYAASFDLGGPLADGLRVQGPVDLRDAGGVERPAGEDGAADRDAGDVHAVGGELVVQQCHRRAQTGLAEGERRRHGLGD